MYRPTGVKENSVSIYFTLIIFVPHSYVDIRGIGPTDFSRSLHPVVGQETRNATPPLRYEVFATDSCVQILAKQIFRANRFANYLPYIDSHWY